MFDTVCTLPLSSELFAQALHPSEPVVAVGLSAGHVQSFRLPSTDEDLNGHEGASNGYGNIVTQWRTRRHKGSCRSLVFSVDGEVLFSAGTDGILKSASAHTGQVSSKIAIPPLPTTSDPDLPTLIHALTPQNLLIATESSALHFYDLRSSPAPLSRNQKAQQTYHPHEDYISSITPLPSGGASISGFCRQFVTTGATTLAVTDLRRGVLAQSEDQEEELLSSTIVSGLRTKAGQGNSEKVAVGGAGGVLTLWPKGSWVDQGERVILDRNIDGAESLDALTVLPDDMRRFSRGHVAVGMGNGAIKMVNLSQNKVVGELRHDDFEGVVALGIDSCRRLISGGGQLIKVWAPRNTAQEEENDGGIGTRKREQKELEGDAGDASGSENEVDAEEDVIEEKKRKKRKRNKGRDKNVGKDILSFKGID